jgi:hypothetical protein
MISYICYVKDYKSSKIDSDLITVKILNIEEVLNEEENDLLEEALSEREKGRYRTFEEVFE